MSHPDPFQDLVDALRRTITSTSTPAPPATTSSFPAASPSPVAVASPMAKPAPFTGLAENCNGFLLQCSLVLEMQPHLYPNDSTKVAYIISQLEGKALRWAEPLWTQKNPIVKSYSSFVNHFKEVFRKPAWDSSVGERLCQLKQGLMSVSDYAIQFRTLAAASGWNEQALITTYRQGLDPRVRLHLAAYEDSIGLEKFIQLSTRFATRMQLCLDEHQGQPLFPSPFRQPELISHPEPASEPMHVEYSRLTSTERQRRLTQNLCIYCGCSGHFIAECPFRPVRPMVSVIMPVLNKMKPLTIVVTLTAADLCLSVNALLDSGSAGNFISGTLCRQLQLKTTATPKIYQIHSVTGKPLRQVCYSVGPLHLQIGVLHMEEINLLVLEESTADVILGRPWLEQHNPIISWRIGEILKWAAADEDVLLNDDDVLSLTSSDPGASALLAAGPREQEMAVEEEADEPAAPSRPPCPAYAELLEVMDRASGRLQLPWGRVWKETARGRLDERFLSGHNPITPVSLPFLPDLHVEIKRAWKCPYSARIHPHQRGNFADVEELGQHGKMEEFVVCEPQEGLPRPPPEVQPQAGLCSPSPGSSAQPPQCNVKALSRSEDER
ncbi:Retrotransposon-derived protein PEG10 [Anabarilius grahami]|uniref:Retrotransposon-derived protein PEG10 n=1 Tax=Anabarilius grahami TaxID=495550 RepID=A0A3N0YQN1_ANAGA|nr:Retrotransposon-derived protein PEG10 [Anabarilius grahami]